MPSFSDLTKIPRGYRVKPSCVQGGRRNIPDWHVTLRWRKRWLTSSAFSSQSEHLLQRGMLLFWRLFRVRHLPLTTNQEKHLTAHVFFFFFDNSTAWNVLRCMNHLKSCQMSVLIKFEPLVHLKWDGKVSFRGILHLLCFRVGWIKLTLVLGFVIRRFALNP